MWYEYKDANGEWRPLPNAQGCGTELNKYNETTFDPVTTTAIRMNMTPKTLGCGVIEWQVIGYADNVIDKNELRTVLENANALDLSLFSAEEDQLAQLQSVIDEAQAVYDSKEATQGQVDAAADKLAKQIVALPTSDGNLAYSAAVSTSYVSSWEKLAGVNDGKVPENSYNPSIPKYGSWGNAGEYETITYTWPCEITLNGSDIYFWYDGDEGNSLSGGIQSPKEYYFEYLDAEGNWKKVENPSAYDTAMDQFNSIRFDEVKTTALRITMVKQNNDGNGVGVVEWKVYGSVAADKTALNEAIARAEGKAENLYTEESWKVFEEALANAKAAAGDEKASQTEIDDTLAALLKAQDNLEFTAEETNIAPEASATGICNYDGQDGRPYDQGGLPKMNDQIDPVSSSDLSNGTWLNWNDRYDADGEIQNAWVAYTWESPVVLTSTDVYYFTDGSGHMMPESVSFEYLNDAGEWVEITGVTPGCEKDKYNTTELGGIRTTSLRMTMVPQFLKENDPACGVGVIEWKVFGRYDEGGEVSADKEALNQTIREAGTRVESDYPAEDWAAFKEVLDYAEDVAADDSADQETVDDAAARLQEAIEALDASKKESADKTALEELIRDAQGYNRADYTVESWKVFTDALAGAYSVNQDEEAEQADVDRAAEELRAAIKGLEKAHADVDLDEIRALIGKVQQLDKNDYTEQSWEELDNALTDAVNAVNNPEVTQDQIDQKSEALKKAIEALKKAESGEGSEEEPEEEPQDKPDVTPGETPDADSGNAESPEDSTAAAD